MGSIIIRNVSSHTKDALRRRAAMNGHSLEEEARIILKEAVSANPPHTLGWATQFRITHNIAWLYADDSKEIDWANRDADPSADHRTPSFE